MTLTATDKIDKFVKLSAESSWTVSSLERRGREGCLDETIGYKEQIPLGGYPAGRSCNF